MKHEINLPEGTNVVTVLEGKAPKVRQIEEVLITGAIDTPLVYTEKNLEKVNNNDCRVEIDRENMQISLVVGQHFDHQDIIQGKLIKTEKLLKWKINTGEQRSAKDLSKFIKMNIADFEDRSTGRGLVNELQNIKAKVNAIVENLDDNKGNKRVLIDQTLTSNVPDQFEIFIEIFKGMPKQKIKVEVYINTDFECQLISSDLNEIIEDSINESINDVLLNLSEKLDKVPFIEC